MAKRKKIIRYSTFRLPDYKPEDKTTVNEPANEIIGLFPIVINLCNVGQIKLIKSAEDLPIGVAFTIIETNRSN